MILSWEKRLLSDGTESPLDDVRAVAEALADVLAERGLTLQMSSDGPARVLDTNQVAALLGRDRQWVYAHAGELGAFRYGDGPKARLGFDLATVERWKQQRTVSRSATPRPKARSARSRKTGSSPRLIPYDASIKAGVDHFKVDER
jgi:predicted DNA-binding transcriptional regulator AlpA